MQENRSEYNAIRTYFKGHGHMAEHCCICKKSISACKHINKESDYYYSTTQVRELCERLQRT